MHPEQGPQHLKFGGGVGESVLSPAVLLVVLIAGVLILILPRNKAMVPFLIIGALIPMDQILLIGPAHFPMLRVLVLFGLFRMAKDKMKSKLSLCAGGFNKIDWAVTLSTVFIALNGILLFREMGAVVYQLGNLFTVFGVYFFLRFAIRDENDVVRTIQTFAYICVVVAAVMTYERATGHNPYAVLGGAAASQYATLAVRDDKIRAQGPFAHSILAGTFGAVLVPLFIALWWKGKKNRKIIALGILSASVMTVACNSSTPVLAYGAGLLALFLWPLRRWMRVLRWSIVITLITLHLSMKAPVWNLINRIDISGGSSGWHRFMLIDQCIHHFSDWWLVGVKDTSVWGWDMWDTANQYVGTCDNSGLIPFILLIATIVYGFKFVGRARRVATAAKDKKRALFVWAIGAALFSNVIAFVGISYFDQTMVVWYGLLAMISAVALVRPKRELKETPIATSSEEPTLAPQLAVLNARA